MLTRCQKSRYRKDDLAMRPIYECPDRVLSLLYSQAISFTNKKALLSQGEPRDAAVNFDMYRILQ